MSYIKSIITLKNLIKIGKFFSMFRITLCKFCNIRLDKIRKSNGRHVKSVTFQMRKVINSYVSHFSWYYPMPSSWFWKNFQDFSLNKKVVTTFCMFGFFALVRHPLQIYTKFLYHDVLYQEYYNSEKSHRNRE